MKKNNYFLKVILAITIAVINSISVSADGRDYGAIVNKQIMVNNLGYSLSEDDMTAYLNNGKKAVGDVVIPSIVRYGNKVYTVKVITTCAFDDNNNITSVKVPNTVVEISNHAFYGCENLSSIQLPNSIEKIGIGAFKCTKIEEITIPEKVKEIYDHTLRINNLKTVKLQNPNTIIYTDALPWDHKVEIIGGGIVKDYEYKFKIFDTNGNLIGYRSTKD